MPAYRASNYLARCLASLGASRPPPGEILVVFDGEPEPLPQPNVGRFLTLPQRRGAAAARNAGARATRGEALVFVDADVTVPPDFFGRIARTFRQHPEIDALFGSYDDDPGASNFLSQYRNLLHHFVHQTSRQQASTFFSACGAIRRETFDALGGFDESSKLDDIDLGYRLTTAGHRTLLDKELLVRHNKEWRVFSMLRADIFLRALPWTELTYRYRWILDDLNLRQVYRWSGVLAVALAATLVAALWNPSLLWVAGPTAGGLLAANWPLYRFFLQRRGLVFLLAAIPWHWFYFLYCSLAFGWGTLLYGWRSTRTPSNSS